MIIWISFDYLATHFTWSNALTAAFYKYKRPGIKPWRGTNPIFFLNESESLVQRNLHPKSQILTWCSTLSCHTVWSESWRVGCTKKFTQNEERKGYEEKKSWLTLYQNTLQNSFHCSQEALQLPSRLPCKSRSLDFLATLLLLHTQISFGHRSQAYPTVW